MKLLTKGNPRVVLIGAIALLLSGCSPKSPDLKAKLSNPKGLTRGSKVVWQGQEVGIVTKVRPQSDYFLAEIRLWQEFRGQIRDGATSFVEVVPPRHKPILRIYGGKNSLRPAIAKGAILEEASVLDRVQIKATFVQWLKSSNYFRHFLISIPLALLAMWLVFKFVKRIIKIVLVLVILFCLAGLCYVIRYEWDRYEASQISLKTKAVSTDFFERADSSPEAQQSRSDMKGESQAAPDANRPESDGEPNAFSED